MRLMSYAAGRWVAGTGRPAILASAVTGEPVAEIDSTGLDFAAMLDHARTVGGPALRTLTFHERARMLKALASYLMERKEELYALSTPTGATRADGWIDIEGGIGTLFAYASKGRRELPNAHLLHRRRARAARQGRHLRRPAHPRAAARASPSTSTPSTSRSGACWRSSRRPCSPACPRSSSPPRQTAYLTEAMVRRIVESGILPEGALQLIIGGDRRPARPPDRPGRGHLHRLGRHRPQAARPSQRDRALGAASTWRPTRLNCLHPRPRRRARHAGVRPVRQGGRARDDGQGRAEMHRHPPRHRAAASTSTRCRRAARPAGQDRRRRPRRSTAVRMGALASLAQRDEVRERVARAAPRRRRVVSGEPGRRRAVGADAERRRLLRARSCCCCRRAPARRRASTTSRPSARSAPDALRRPRRRDRARHARQGQPGRARCSPHDDGVAARGRPRRRPPTTAAC